MTITETCSRARLALVASMAFALGCATPGASRTAPSGSAPGSTPSLGPTHAGTMAMEPRVEAVLATARETLGQDRPRIEGRPAPADCSGYLRALYATVGVNLFSEGQPSDNGVRTIVRWIERHGLSHRGPLAAPGDLVFFDNSYDRNGDGRLDDRFTHAGLVEEVLPDGTLLIIHATNHGIVREPMNLLKPHDATDAGGRTINAPLRRKGPRDDPRTPRLMSELFAGFGRVVQRENASPAPG
jgi:hypothetical protein